MALIDMLNDDRDSVMLSLAGAETPQAAQGAVEKELDRLLYRYQETADSEAARAAASKLIQTAKASLMFVDSDGEAQIWERLPGDGQESTSLVAAASGALAKSGSASKPAAGRRYPISVWGVLFFMAGIGLGVAAAVLLVLHIPRITQAGQWELILGLGLGGLVASFLGGLFLRKKKKRGAETEKRVEVRRDPAKIYRALQTVILTIDKQLALTVEEEKAAEQRRLAAAGGPLDEAEINLMSSLLEALYSRDSEFALDRLEDVRFYLHQKEIDLVDYTGEHETWFELMPSDKAGTIRPALVCGGRLLKKGLAAAAL